MEDDGKLSPVLEGGPMKMPSPLITRRTRTLSTSERALRNPEESGTIVSFCRTKGHGFIKRDDPRQGEDPSVFVHVSDIEGEFIPLPEDRVTFRLCAIPPKFERHQAINVRIINFCHSKHHRWTEPPTAEERQDTATFVN